MRRVKVKILNAMQFTKSFHSEYIFKENNTSGGQSWKCSSWASGKFNLLKSLFFPASWGYYLLWYLVSTY